MWIVPTNCHPERIVSLLVEEYLPVSRFRILELTSIPAGPRGSAKLKILGVRLKHKKDYCGQHAGPCRTQGGRKHKIASWLEGGDWVGFNDLLNDLCDKHRIEADIWSTRESIGRLYLRKGIARCTHYAAGNGQDWINEAFSTDHFGHPEPAPRSDYEDGTPGIPEWLLSKEAEYQELFDHV